MIRMLALKTPATRTVVANLLLSVVTIMTIVLLTLVIVLLDVYTRKSSAMMTTNVQLILVTQPPDASTPLYPQTTIMLALWTIVIKIKEFIMMIENVMTMICAQRTLVML
jgi:hypothetical protein